jgi:hypothetical protein
MGRVNTEESTGYTQHGKAAAELESGLTQRRRGRGGKQRRRVSSFSFLCVPPRPLRLCVRLFAAREQIGIQQYSDRQPSQMPRGELRATQAFQRLSHTMPVTLLRQTLETRQDHSLARPHPGQDRFQRRALLRQTLARKLREQRIVIRLRLQFPTLIRRDTQRRHMLIPDAPRNIRPLCGDKLFSVE